MDTIVVPTWLNQINTALLLSTVAAAVLNFIPRLLIAILVFLVGRWVANSVAKTVAKLFAAINVKQVVSSFQLGLEMNKQTEQTFVTALSMISRYIVLYGVMIVVLQVIGLTSVANFFIRLTDVAPKLLSSLLILLIGIISAGFVESLVKRAVKVLDPATARLSGKVSSYVVISFFILMALAELGLAATFVNTLFIGLVATVVLSLGLAIGLGAKDLVAEVLLHWYKRRL